jgi:ADP-ribose pyrophosphatase YjhB (NUDIX family)
MSDILFHGDGRIFSCRAAGILIRGDKILLQKPLNDAHAFPGGHVSFGETGAETIIREFREESGADIEVEGLKWIE